MLFSAGFAGVGRLNSKLAAIDILPAGYGGSGRLEAKVLTVRYLSTPCHAVRNFQSESMKAEHVNNNEVKSVLSVIELNGSMIVNYLTCFEERI